VAVVVTHDAPPDRLDRVVSALAAQDHPNLEVLVVDTGTRDATERVRAALPRARVERVGDIGFGAAANTVLDVVSGAAYYLFCHDDVVPDPRAVTALLAAAERWDADVVGPKLVAADDPRRLLQFGLTVDKLGFALPFVERRELDQGQHDGLRDVFAVPGACTLVRAAAFAEVGGFDEAIDFLGDDLSLCWRIRVAGGRVLVTSGARARHEEAFVSRRRAAAAPALAARHRLRVVLSSYRVWSLATIVPMALVVSLVQALGALVTGRAGQARAALGAWPWNLARLRSLRDARRAVASFRRVKDHDVRRSMVRGLVGPRVQRRRVEGPSLLPGGRRPGGGRRVVAVPERGHMDVDPGAWTPATVAVAAIVAGILVFGSRHLLTRYVPVVGEMVPVGDDALGSWAAGVRPSGFAAGGAWPPSLAAAGGLLGGALLGHLALARTLLTVGLIPLGVVGAHRMADRLESRWAQVAAAVAYAAVPLPYDALAAGRWTALGAYATAPWMLRRLAVGSGLAPFGPPGGDRAPRRLGHQVVAAGAVTALAGLVVPQAPALLLVMGAALILGTLAGLEVRGVLPLAAMAAGGAVVAALLLLPTTLDVLGSRAAFDAWLGPAGGPRGMSALDVAGLATGEAALRPASFALAGAALVPLLVGRGWRLAWALRAWALVLAAGALVWAGEQGHLGVALPDPGVLLAPAAAGLSLAVALGAAAVAADVRGRSWRFGLRRIVVALGVVALLASTASLGRAAVDGWWGTPTTSYAALLRFVNEDTRAGSSRVLWAGDSALIPGGAAWELGDGLSYTTSIGSIPTVPDRWPAAGDDRATGLRRALAEAVGGRTTRLGAALAPFGVAYVAVPATLAPGDDTPAAPATADLRGALATQLDLARVQVDLDLVLYRNAAFDPESAAEVASPPADGIRPPATAQVLMWLAAAAVALRLRFAPLPPPPDPPSTPAFGELPPAGGTGAPDPAREPVGAGA
jgi:GT2 family glycosyltransferase